MTLKAFLKLVLPPFVLEIYRALRRTIRRAGNRLVFSREVDEIRASAAEWQGYESAAVIARERDNWKSLIQILQNGHQPLVTKGTGKPDTQRMTGEHNAYMTFGYVLALAAQRKSAVKILDYGGELGHYYFIGKALLPEVALEYHCKELPEMAKAGRKVSPSIIWHTDDSCFEQHYDLIIFSGSLQYIRNWQEVLHRASRAAREYVYLMYVPVVEFVPSYVALQSLDGAQMIHRQFNKSELLSTIGSAGLRIIREFWVEDHPSITNAPEQPSHYGCLLKRDG